MAGGTGKARHTVETDKEVGMDKPTLILALAFFMIRAAPGGPFDAERSLPAEVEANLRAAYHLDEPLIQQFGRYLINLLQGDFGPSFQYKDYTVTELIMTGFPVSLKLGGLAMLSIPLLLQARGRARQLILVTWLAALALSFPNWPPLREAVPVLDPDSETTLLVRAGRDHASSDLIQDTILEAGGRSRSMSGSARSRDCQPAIIGVHGSEGEGAAK